MCTRIQTDDGRLLFVCMQRDTQLYKAVKMPKRTATRRLDTATCPKCGRVVAVLIPKDGDGSADVFRTHKNHDGKRCDMSRMLVPAECH